MNAQFYKPLVFSLVLVLSCSSQNKEEGQKLHLHFPIKQLVLDPQHLLDAYSMTVTTQIYRGLFRYDSKNEPVPDIAESWTESPDHTKFVITLKKRTFSDGTPITSQNVQMTFARMFDSGASMGADLDYIFGAKKFKLSHNLNDFGVSPLSDDQVEFKLSHPSVLFLKHLAVADCAILPLKNFKESLSATVFSGPYKIVNRSTNSIELRKWRTDEFDSVKPPKVVSYFSTDKDPITLGLDGSTDTLDDDAVSTDVKSKLIAKGWSSVPSEVVDETFLVVNPDHASENIRRYLFSRVNAEDLKNALALNNYSGAYGLIPKGVGGELTKEDRKQFKSPRGPSPTGKIIIDLDRDNLFQKSIAQYLKKVWETPELHVELNPISKSEKLNMMFAKKGHITIGQKGVDYPDGLSVLTYFKSHIADNYFFVNDPKIDKALDKLTEISDTHLREQGYKTVQLQILAHFTVIPLLFGSQASGLWSSKIKDIPPHPMGYHSLPLETVELN